MRSVAMDIEQDEAFLNAIPAGKEFLRRRSADIGGLALAFGSISLGDDGMGHGWGGWEADGKNGAHFAELLSDMYTQTLSAINVPVPLTPTTLTRETRFRLIDSLDRWDFEPHKLSDEEALACTELLFESLLRREGMKETISVPLTDLGAFLRHLRQVYRDSNSYHNFQHALDVFQAIHIFLMSAGAVPPVSVLLQSPDDISWIPRTVTGSHVSILNNEALFALHIAAVGHDVGHPGFTNNFMKNSQAPLSEVYDHKSALEQMHSAFLYPIMKQHGLGHLLCRNTKGTCFRKLLLGSILATDMAVHNTFMMNFSAMLQDPERHDLFERRLLLCQALLKCADISNPSRPHTVSRHWSAALSSEWANQAILERHLQLPNSVMDTADPIAEANVQINFITIFTQPLLEITANAIPEMTPFAEQSATNCSLWKSRLDELKSNNVSNYPPVPYRPISPPQAPDLSSVFPLSLPPIPKEFLSSEDAAMSLRSDSPARSGTTSASTATDSRSPSPYTDGHGSAHSSQHNLPTSIHFNSPVSSSSMTHPPIHPFSPLDFDMKTNTSSPVSPRAESIFSIIDGGPRTSEPISAIRAAYERGVRKKKSFHRSSWTPSLNSFSWQTSGSTYVVPPLPTGAFLESPKAHFVSTSEIGGVSDRSMVD